MLEIFLILSNISNIISYFPNIYALIYDYEMLLFTQYMWYIWLFSGITELIYDIYNNNYSDIISDILNLSMIILCLILTYYKTHKKNNNYIIINNDIPIISKNDKNNIIYKTINI
jgi:hypothetical protein